MQLVDIPEVGLLTAPNAGATRPSTRYAQDFMRTTIRHAHDKKDKETSIKITNASASTPASGAFAFGPDNREVIH
jgi:hypothetical protein